MMRDQDNDAKNRGGIVATDATIGRVKSLPAVQYFPEDSAFSCIIGTETGNLL